MTEKIQDLQCFAWPFKVVTTAIEKAFQSFEIGIENVRLHFQSHEGLPKQQGKSVRAQKIQTTVWQSFQNVELVYVNKQC